MGYPSPRYEGDRKRLKKTADSKPMLSVKPLGCRYSLAYRA